MKLNNTLAYQLFILSTIFTISAMFLSAIPIETTAHFRDLLHIDSAQFINLGSLFFISYSLLQIPGGILFDRFGSKIILPICTVLATAGYIMYWFGNDPITIGASRIISGLGCAVAYTSAVYTASRYFPPSKLPLLIGIIEAFATTGSMLAANPLNWLLTHFGWNTTGIIFSIVLVLLTLTVSIRYFTIREEAQSSNQITSFAEIYRQVWLLLKNRYLILIFIYSFCVWLIIMSFAGYWLKEYMVQMHQYSEGKALSLVEFYWLSFFISSLIIGYLTNDFYKAKLTILLLSAFGFIAYTFMSLPILFNYGELLMVVLAGGISATGVIIAFSLVPRYAKPELCATAISLNNTFVVLGGYFGQIAFGFILKHFDIDLLLSGMLGYKGIESHYYSALLLYLIISGIALSCAILVFRQKTATA